MRTLNFLLFLLCGSMLYAQGVVVNITSAGIGVPPDGDCRSDIAEPDCGNLDGVQDITVAPGAEVALFIQWRNDGSATITEVRATDQQGNPVFPPVSNTLLPGGSDLATVFFNAPVVPGNYTTLLTLTATDSNERDDTDQFRYFITVDQSLPVVFTDFTARATEKDGVVLQWFTQNEENNDRFEVERSLDGRSFVQLGAVAGAGESQTEQGYSFRDRFPLPGENFYRLRQVDVDGRSAYSSVVGVNLAAGLALFPNPAQDELQLPGFAGGAVEIFDALGRLILRQELAAGTPLAVQHLRPGRYLLRAGRESRWWIKR
ncbi:T9SS type A sorting domain-containing protein [Neolewinella lacunae]|uniref:T9SS type A sorting domain-containing protein n=1 Tax=Neolewinella lacunae TaxID=1517758 RepID=A0A923PMJ8_9BACT|nr:T9SS type A sorting domain-containing protein [Neolewinella lacunae]MBC6995466.1 T9SS type A sorting domain-containing protein [Neolewinella lacunae]MDN3635054.1 T9SS type A sorting domain-containing protein [Neolewinella lacunae]